MRAHRVAAMIAEMVMSAGAVTAGGFAYAKSRRAKLYRELADRVARIAATTPLLLPASRQSALPSFADRLIFLRDFLPEAAFAQLKAEAERLVAPERSFVPAHKKGGTVAYETLIASAPAIVSCYHSQDLTAFVSRLVGAKVQPTPISDQSSLSLLFYDKPGDHIGWHYDHNFYRGRHFTLLLALDNQGRAANGLSHAELKARIGGQERGVATPPNTMVVFEGAGVSHKVTPILEGERRLVLSMTYCADPRAYWWQGVTRRIKDTAFYGIRALWT
ncbi:2OG-Fe(II) oxygenase superfamily protein [Rhizobiales bacterium GAS191]|nr:2OG-Fe(II) oxygenase superfamily protein [Rhizobiales bacterium GAS191]